MLKAIPRRFSLCAVAGVLAAACTTSGPSGAPAPAPTPEDSAAGPVHVTARWTPRRAAGQWRYEFRSTGVVSLAGDSTASALPIGRTVFYTISITPTASTQPDGAAFQFNGSVDSVAVTVPERIPTPTAGTNSRPHFQGALAPNGHVLSLSSNATTSCPNSIDPLSASATLLFVALPPGIGPTQSWTDTVLTTTCRGRMALATTATRHYEAISDTVWRGRAAILIARTDSLTVSSVPDSTGADTATAAQGSADTMAAAGSGRGEFTLFVDPITGVLLEATGTSQADIVVTTKNSRFPFHEEARQTISLAGP